MVSARPDLNGRRLVVTGEPEVWLMFNGMRHHIDSPAVYDSLFSETDGVSVVSKIEGVLRGPDLNEGTCLVRSRETHAIFLVTGFPATEVRRHHIRSWNDFLAFGFDEDLVRDAPEILILAIQAGRALEAVLPDIAS
jgi:hypothetical protein